MTNVLLVGSGAIGVRHALNLLKLRPDAKLSVWRQHGRSVLDDSLAAIADNVFTDRNAALQSGCTTCIVANPSVHHTETALAAAAAGMDLLIEKPLSHQSAGLDDLSSLVRERHLIAMVGYNLRFCSSLVALKNALDDGEIGRPLFARVEVGQYLPDWRPAVDYRATASARRDLGGGAVLELTHELDYACWMLGDVQSVFADAGRLSDLDMDVEDTAELVVRFTSGAMGNIHLDMVQQGYHRSCKIVGSKGTLTWDGSSHEVRLYDGASRAWRVIHPSGTLDRNAMYLEEMRHFLACCETRSQPLITLADGIRVVRLAELAHESVAAGRVMTP